MWSRLPMGRSGSISRISCRARPRPALSSTPSVRSSLMRQSARSPPTTSQRCRKERRSSTI
eukprot:9021697-Pyramimonas_sp.AAC.1